VVVSLSGTVVGAVSSILVALIPALIIYLDFSIGTVFITWSLLLRYYLGVDLHDALMFSFVATIVYAMILVLTGGFFFLILRLHIS